MRIAGPVTLGLLVAVAGMSPTCAQDAAQANDESSRPDTSSLVLHLDVRRVPVDVVVLDKHGDQVRGLKADDFVVKEDGKRQRLLSFDFFNGVRPSYLPSRQPVLPPNTYSNLPATPERGPLYVLYYDMVNTPEENQMQFHNELLKVVDSVPAGTRMALFMNASGLHLVQGFTADRAVLRAAILKKGPGPHLPDVFLYGNVYGRYDAGAALSNLTFLAEYLRGLPGRKNLIWLARTFPIPVGPTRISVEGGAVTAGQAPPSGGVGNLGGPEFLDLTELLRDSVKRAYSAMMQSQVALYPVSLAGVAGATALGEGADAMVEYDKMGAIASATGGHAFYSSNRPSELIGKVIGHGESYYTLTYSPSNTNFDGSERSIEVTLAKKGDYRLTYRRLYYALSDSGTRKLSRDDALQARFVQAKEKDTLFADIEHGAPIRHDLLFTAQLSTPEPLHMATPEQMVALETSPDYFVTRKRNRGKPLPPIKLRRYVIDYGVVDPQLREIPGRRAPKPVLEFAAAAYNADGRLLNSILNQGVPARQPGKKKGVFHAIQDLEVPPEAAFLRLAVRDIVNNHTGTIEVDLPLASSGAIQSAGRTAGSGNS